MPVIGFVNGQGPREFAHFVTAFHQGLGETGYVEGQNVAIEYRWAEGQETRISTLIEDLVRLSVAVVVITGSGQGALAAKAVRSTVPMVVGVGIDPVKSGLVASLNLTPLADECPQPAEADMRALERDSGFDPERLSAGKIAVMHSHSTMW